MKRLFYLALVLPALLLRAAFHVSAKTVSAEGTPAKTTPSGRLSPDLDLGPKTAGPLSQPVLAHQVANIDQHIVEDPDGEFTAGLRVKMVKFNRTTGRFAKSLEDWRAACVACAQYCDGSGKLLADKVLAGLGRVEESQQMFLSNPTGCQNY